MEMKSRRECPASQRGKRPLREAEKKERQRERGRGKRSRARGVSGRRRGPSTGADARSRVPGATVPLKTCQTVSCSHRAQLLCRHAGCGKVSDEEKDGRARTPHLSVRLGPNGGQCPVMIIPEVVRATPARCPKNDAPALWLCPEMGVQRESRDKRADVGDGVRYSG